MHACMYVCKSVCVYVCMYVCTCVCVSLFVCIAVVIRVWPYVSVHARVYMYGRVLHYALIGYSYVMSCHAIVMRYMYYVMVCDATVYYTMNVCVDALFYVEMHACMCVCVFVRNVCIIRLLCMY